MAMGGPDPDPVPARAPDHQADSHAVTPSENLFRRKRGMWPDSRRSVGNGDRIARCHRVPGHASPSMVSEEEW